MWIFLENASTFKLKPSCIAFLSIKNIYWEVTLFFFQNEIFVSISQKLDRNNKDYVAKRQERSPVPTVKTMWTEQQHRLRRLPVNLQISPFLGPRSLFIFCLKAAEESRKRSGR